MSTTNGAAPLEDSTPLQYEIRRLAAELGEAQRALGQYRRLEDILQDRGAALRAILNATTESVLLIGADGVVLTANATGLRRLGLPAEAVIDRPLDTILPAEVAGPRLARLREVVESGLPVQFEDERAGIPFQHSVFPVLDSAGRVTAVAAFTRDLTSHRRAEEAIRLSEGLYRAIGESIDYGVWVSAPDGRNTYTSESFLTLVGMVQEECADFGWASALHPDDAVETLAAWKECVRTGEAWYREHRYRGVDGQWHDVLSRGVPVRDPRGEIRCWAGINLDISRLKRAEEDLRRLTVLLDQRVVERTAELAQAVEALHNQRAQLRALAADLTLTEQRERDRLADFLHSDLQQLLVATRLRAVALGRAPDPQVQADAREILALTEEAISATRTLTRELSPPSLQRGGLLPALEWLAAWVLEKHKLTVHLSTLPGPPPSTPPALAVLLYQAVRELLLNAVKHAHVAAVEVTFSAESGGLTVAVADAGVGFDPALLRTAGGREGGFGLLGIHERLEWVGGRLSVVSAPGQGSRFTLWAPLPAASEKAPPPPRTIRIIVVDDHALIRQAIITMLAAEPDLHVVGEAMDGQQAVALVQSLAPDVVLMDVSMPVMGGIPATRAICAAHPAVRVIGLSAAEDPAQEEAMRQAGARAYLRKSELAEALLTAIREAGAPPETPPDSAVG